jgi:hypothetical protein
MGFPSRTHLQLTPPGIGLTDGQMEYLYQIYDAGVLSNKISIMKDLVEKPTYTYLKQKSGYKPEEVVAFLMSLKDYAIKFDDEDWRNPLYREKKESDTVSTIKSIFTTPLDVASKAVGNAGKNITDPITKPLIAVSVIAASGVIFYGLFKFGVFKKLAKKLK